MNSTGRIFLLSALLMLLLVLSVVSSASHALSVIDNDQNFDGTDHGSSATSMPGGWVEHPFYPLAVVLKPGISIFIALVVYLGGRSKVRRFNDRTIEAEMSFLAVVLQTTPLLRGVVFVCFSLNLLCAEPCKTFYQEVL